ncbi:hypothetical protein B0H13DRAFT_1916178 [Mycena leptocephala]|nr:hypothetical protein B0H13DRAFT_1916178 [Mycena leptocephala]
MFELDSIGGPKLAIDSDDSWDCRRRYCINRPHARRTRDHPVRFLTAKASGTSPSPSHDTDDFPIPQNTPQGTTKGVDPQRKVTDGSSAAGDEDEGYQRREEKIVDGNEENREYQKCRACMWSYGRAGVSELRGSTMDPEGDETGIEGAEEKDDREREVKLRVRAEYQEEKSKRRTKQPPSRRPEQRGMVRSHLVLLERGMKPEPADEEASSTKEAIWVWGTRQTGYGVRGWGASASVCGSVSSQITGWDGVEGEENAAGEKKGAT